MIERLCPRCSNALQYAVCFDAYYCEESCGWNEFYSKEELEYDSD